MLANYLWYIVGAIVAFGIGFGSIYFMLKKNEAKKKAMTIPADVLKDFNEFERRMRQSNGTKEPTKILWEFAQERFNERSAERDREFSQTAGTDSGRSIAGIPATGIQEQPVIRTSADEQPAERIDLQIQYVEQSESNNAGNSGEHVGNSGTDASGKRSGFWGKFRGTKK